MIDANIFDSSMARQVTENKSVFSVLEHNRVSGFVAEDPSRAYFYSKQGIRKRQLVCQLNGRTGIIMQSGAMQIMMGDVKADSNVGGVGGLLRGVINARANNESIIKPRYMGTGVVVLEPTWKYILLEDLAEWNGSMVIDDGLFLACETTANIQTVARTNISSAVAGGEGLFNTMMTGTGVVALESRVPRDELICIELQNDEVKIDGNMAIAWSGSLQFTVERSMRTLIGSAISGEGLVNVYRGTGRVLVAAL